MLSAGHAGTRGDEDLSPVAPVREGDRLDLCYGSAMTRQTQAPSGFPRYGVPVRAADAPVRSGNTNEEAARAGNWAAAPWPSQGRPPQQAAAPQPGVPRPILAAIVLVLAGTQVWVASRGGVATMMLGAVIVLVIARVARLRNQRGAAAGAGRMNQTTVVPGAPALRRRTARLEMPRQPGSRNQRE